MTQWVSNADVVTWLGPQIDDTTATILALAASDAVRDYIERDITLGSFTDVYDSNGTDYILLANWPVVAITSVSIFGWPTGQTVPAFTTMGTPGYRMDNFNPRKLIFAGYGKIPKSIQNVMVSYSAGYDLTQTPGSPTGLPASFYLALKLTTNAIYNAQAADTNLASENTAGVFSGSYYPSGAGAVPPGARSLLNNYRRASP